MVQPVKVLQIGMTPNIGGMETYLMAQYRKLNRDIVRYDFLNITGENEIVFADEIRKNGDKIYAVPSRHKLPFHHYLGICKLLLKNRHDYKYVVLNTCSLYYVFPLFMAALVGISHRVIHSHNSGDEGKSSFPRNIIKMINRVLLKISATDYWACSNLAGTWMFGSHSFKVIHNAIDAKRFIFDPKVRKKVRGKLHLEGKFVIGTVARFSPQKNHEFLIKVFREVVKREPNSVLMLVGEAAGFQDRWVMIHQKVQEYNLQDKVLFLGMRKDTDELYQAMDCHVLPSKFEGLCITALEAQAAGLPCICSDALPEETKVTDNYYSLPLTLPAGKWADFIIKNMQQDRKDMLKEFVDAGYDIDTEVKKITNLYV